MQIENGKTRSNNNNNPNINSVDNDNDDDEGIDVIDGINAPCKSGNNEPGEGDSLVNMNKQSKSNEQKKKRRKFPPIKQNSKLSKVIRFLEDRRIHDDCELYQLEDLQMPRLRRVLNILFVSLGMMFLLGVITAIIYTTLFPSK